MSVLALGLRRHVKLPTPSGATILSTGRHEPQVGLTPLPQQLTWILEDWLEELRFEVLDEIEALGGFDGAVLEGQRPWSVALDVLEAEIDAVDVATGRYRGGQRSDLDPGRWQSLRQEERTT